MTPSERPRQSTSSAGADASVPGTSVPSTSDPDRRFRYVVRLGPDDWRTYRQLRLEMVTDSPEAFWTTREELETYTEADWRARSTDRTLQARAADGTPLGTLTVLTPRPYRETGLGPDDALVLAVYVTPPARGTGVVEALLAAAHDLAVEELGARRLVLHVHEHNARAIRVYERAGYRLDGRSLEHPTDPDHLDLEMELVLR